MAKPSVFKKLSRDELRQRFDNAPLMQRRELALILLPTILVVLAALALAYQFVEPAPPRMVVMSTGSEKGAFHGFGKRYAEILARDGVTLVLKPSNGSKENADRLVDPKSGVQVALVQGGVVDGQEGRDLVSLGRVYQQPLWVFYRAPQTLNRFSEFRGKRLAIGPEGSGTRGLMIKLFEATSITEKDATFLGFENNEAARQLIAGEVDAIFLATAADSPVVKRLLGPQGRDVKLMSVAQAEAYTRKFPHLNRVILPAGVVDLDGNVPPEDYVLLSPQASLLARADLHPAIVGLLVRAAREVHSEGGMFQRLGEYPVANDTDIAMSADALRVYTSGTTFLHRHLPFWVATFIERMLVMVVPIATILLPLLKIVPWIYQWRIKNRILHWYAELKRVERGIALDRSPEALEAALGEVDRIEEAAGVIPVPVTYSAELYNLKGAVALVRQRITAKV